MCNTYGCGEAYTLSHVLDCHHGELVTHYHNEVRDALRGIAALAFREVIQEPVVHEWTEGSPALTADLGVTSYDIISLCTASYLGIYILYIV